MKVNYYMLGDTTPSTMSVMSGVDVETFKDDVLCIPAGTKVRILVNGDVCTDYEMELEDGDTIKVEALKSDSGV